MADKKHNLGKMEQFVRDILRAEKQTDLILFPELINTGYECGKEFFGLAEAFPDGESLRFMSELAKRFNTHILFGFAEQDPAMDGVLYNSVALIDNEGKPLGVYRKVHLFGEEALVFRPGCSYPLFRTRIGKIGIFVCWDALFPEVARIYALQGADLLAVSTNWEDPYASQWDFLTSARAFDNTLHLAAANRIGKDKTLSFFGHSRILDPMGGVIRSLDEAKEGFASAELDLEETRRLRAEYWTQLKDRRPDTYALLSQSYLPPGG
jgi:predicted amidohydrolase